MIYNVIYHGYNQEVATEGKDLVCFMSMGISEGGLLVEWEGHIPENKGLISKLM